MFFGTLSNYGRQLAFAIAPLPAYFPQYLTLCRESNDPVLQRHVKRSGSVPGISLEEKTTTDAMHHMNGHAHGHGHGHGHNQVTEGGFSSTSIMILLLSHVFRLQYFLLSAIINFFGPNATKDKAKADKVHFDLVTQSVVMVCIQTLLLSAVTRRRRLANKQKVDRTNHSHNTHHKSPISPRRNSVSNDHHELRLPMSAQASSPLSSPFPSTPPNNKTSSISQKPFIWLVNPRQHWSWDTVRQYFELIVLLNVVTYIFFRRYMYPNDVLDYINTIKIISVLLESCLALPQIVLNYKRKSTEGLSLVMVLGWILGDMMKLIYFIIGSETKQQEMKHHQGGGGVNVQLPVMTVPEELDEGGSSDMTIFIFGCISALIMDFIVGIQVTKWYPSHDMIHMREKLRRAWFKFEIKILRIDPADRHRRGKNRSSSDLDLGI